MPRKKSKEDKQQPRLMEWVGNEKLPLGAEGRKEQMEKEVTKLLKLRREIESKQQEEDRIIKRIVRLQIGEDRQQREMELPLQQEEQQYLILTLHSTLTNVQSPDMIKLCLGDYGETFVNEKKVGDLGETEQSMTVKEQKQNEADVKEWTKNGSLSPQLITDYSNHFLQYLQQMQYNADSLQTSLASK